MLIALKPMDFLKLLMLCITGRSKTSMVDIKEHNANKSLSSTELNVVFSHKFQVSYKI